MAIGWLTILKSVPWSEVISNAPLVADGAKKLWSAVGKQSATEDMQAAYNEDVPPNKRLATESRVDMLEEAVQNLHEQMRASSELIKALADQNAQLIKSVEVNRVRVVWLSRLTAVTSVCALAALVLVLVRTVG